MKSDISPVIRKELEKIPQKSQEIINFSSLAGKFPSKKRKSIPSKFFMEKNYKRI